jgi:hypothetical protein
MQQRRLSLARWEARLERVLLGAGMSLVAIVADFLMARRLRR